MQKTLRRQ